MSDIRDFFIKTLDEAESGINRMMTKLMQKIKIVDPDVEEQLILQEIKPQYFSFRYELPIFVIKIRSRNTFWHNKKMALHVTLQSLSLFYPGGWPWCCHRNFRYRKSFASGTRSCPTKPGPIFYSTFAPQCSLSSGRKYSLTSFRITWSFCRFG